MVFSRLSQTVRVCPCDDDGDYDDHDDDDHGGEVVILSLNGAQGGGVPCPVGWEERVIDSS